MKVAFWLVAAVAWGVVTRLTPRPAPDPAPSNGAGQHNPPMPASWWSRLAGLHSALGDVFSHPWTMNIMGFVEGNPTVKIEVLAPEADAFCYDARVIGAAERHMPSGYYFDGTDVDVESTDGTRKRGFFLYPTVRPPMKSDGSDGLIKISLPGESLWAPVEAAGAPARARLRNESIHGIPFDTEVELGDDGHTVVGPPSVMRQAEASYQKKLAQLRAVEQRTGDLSVVARTLLSVEPSEWSRAIASLHERFAWLGKVESPRVTTRAEVTAEFLTQWRGAATKALQEELAKRDLETPADELASRLLNAIIASCTTGFLLDDSGSSPLN